MSSRAFLWRSQRGLSLIEMIIVCLLVMVASAIAIPVTTRMIDNAKGDSALVMTATFLQAARNRAVAERRNIVVTFVSDQSMQAERVDPIDLSQEVVDSVTLEGDHKFIRDASVPDTPDKFGVGSGAIIFTGTQPVAFTSDGSLIDTAGDVTNGTVFVAREGVLDSARAVSIWGVSGLLRSWKWRGNVWQQ
jgi:Tfp pilus assembly protein FimT